MSDALTDHRHRVTDEGSGYAAEPRSPAARLPRNLRDRCCGFTTRERVTPSKKSQSFKGTPKKGLKGAMEA